MSFNYRKEEYALNKRLEKQRRFFKENGMSDEQIAAVEELEWDEFRYRRNQENVAILRGWQSQSSISPLNINPWDASTSSVRFSRFYTDFLP